MTAVAGLPGTVCGELGADAAFSAAACCCNNCLDMVGVIAPLARVETQPPAAAPLAPLPLGLNLEASMS